MGRINYVPGRLKRRTDLARSGWSIVPRTESLGVIRLAWSHFIDDLLRGEVGCRQFCDA